MNSFSAPKGKPLYAVKHIDIFELVTNPNSTPPSIHHGELCDVKYVTYFVPYNKKGELSNNRYREYNFSYFETPEEAYAFAIAERNEKLERFYTSKKEELNTFFGKYKTYEEFKKDH